MKILISGGSGLVGKHLTELLLSKGYKVGILTRRKKGDKKVAEFVWDLGSKTIDPKAIPWADHLVHLAGENVGQRWTSATKELILNSRVASTELLVNELAATDHKIKSFVSASAIGYYGSDSGNTLVDEQSAKGDGFLADVVESWESVIGKSQTHVNNLVVLRLGVVLASSGGALEKMTNPVRFGIGSPLGSGEQWISWIDINDLCGLIVYTIEQSLSGTYNAVGPKPVTNAEITRSIAKQIKRPVFLPNVPSFVLKLLLGEMSSIVLGGNRVSSAAIQEEGFKFEFGTVEKSLEHLL